MTLTQLSEYLRKYYPYAIVGALFFFILFYSIQLVLLIVESRKPVPITINPVFNQLKRPYLSEATPSGNIKYVFDTIAGEPETATKTAKVYFLPQAETKFGYRERLYLIAKSLGFNTEASGYRLVGSLATFNEPTQKLSIDIKNFNFEYKYSMEENKAMFESASIPSRDESVSKAVEFLQKAGRYPEELAQGKTNVLYLRYNPENNSMVFVDSNTRANVVEVDFYRPDIEAQPNTIPVVSPKYFNSQNYVLLMFHADGSYKVLRSQVKFFDRSSDQVGVYPLRTGIEAYADLKAGKGYVVSGQIGPRVTIKKMFLGYFDPDVYQEYLQPVYVFIGDDDFVAYVSAVSGEYLVE